MSGDDESKQLRPREIPDPVITAQIDRELEAFPELERFAALDGNARELSLNELTYYLTMTDRRNSLIDQSAIGGLTGEWYNIAVDLQIHAQQAEVYRQAMLNGPVDQVDANQNNYVHQYDFALHNAYDIINEIRPVISASGIQFSQDVTLENLIERLRIAPELPHRNPADWINER